MADLRWRKQGNLLAYPLKNGRQFLPGGTPSRSQKNTGTQKWDGFTPEDISFVKSNLELASRECWEFASTPKTSEMCLDPQIWNFQFPLAGSLPTFSHFFCIRTPRRAPTVHTTAYGWLKPYCPAYLSGLC